MNNYYICRVSQYQASGNQIDIPKKIALDFFNVPKQNIENLINTDINLCHIKDLRKFETIQIQPATNIRWSSKLNSFLANNGDNLTEDDLLLFEKIGKSFCVRCLKKDNNKYEALLELFEESEKHMILSGILSNQPQNTETIHNSFRPFITAIKSKPFLLLAGISGTGKSRIVRELARACWDINTDEYKSQKPRNFEMIQVKPNWHDSSELIGYVSRIGADKDGNGVVFVSGEFLKFVAKAWEEPNIPYFLCLDEMNLAPVEQYFAEYLSVVESRKADENGIIKTDPIIKSDEQWFYNLTDKLTHDEEIRIRFNTEGICIPQNLIVVGTVNMDETTFSFSRKVLDRAMTIEMNEVDLHGGLTHRYEQIGKLGTDELVGNAVEGVDVYDAFKDVCDVAITYLEKINNKLDKTPFKIAYRTRNEFLLYVINNLPYNKDAEGKDLEQNFVIARALDEITSMKILSRIEGDESKVSEQFLSELQKEIKSGLMEICKNLFDATSEGKGFGHKSVSDAKLEEMKKKLESGYTSFWS